MRNGDQGYRPGRHPGGPVQPNRGGDAVLHASDNRPLIANADQRDNDGDGIGRACDADERGFCWECLPGSGGWRGLLRAPGQ